MLAWIFALGSGLPTGSSTTTRIVRDKAGFVGSSSKGSAATWRGCQSAHPAASSTAPRIAPPSQPRPSQGGRRPPASSRRTRAASGERRETAATVKAGVAVGARPNQRVGVIEWGTAAGHSPVVARLLGTVAQPAPRKPGERVPGKNANEKLRQQRRPVVVATEMGQLVAENGLDEAGDRRRLLGDQDDGRPAPAPERGRGHARCSREVEDEVCTNPIRIAASFSA